MSHAPKPLPVLRRLAIALRRIPAVELAFAKFKSLLRGRTNDEPAVVSEFQTPSTDVTKDDVVRGVVEAETVADGTETAVAGPVETDTVETEEIKASAMDVAETTTAKTGAAEIDVDEPVTTNVCDAVSPAMVSAQAPLVAIESAEAGAAESEKVETVVRNTDDVTDHVRPPEDSSEAVVAETDVLSLGSAETDNVEVDAIKTAPFEIRTECEAAQPDAIEPEAVETTPTFATGAVDPDAAETFAATVIETDVEQLDLVEADTVETSPVEAITAKADLAPAAITKSDDFCDRETLIRRRWRETGIRMWNPRLHGAGQSMLCIQGRIALLPPQPGESMPGYDRLEFKLIDGLIVCEGFVVDPPELPSARQFA